MNEIRKIYEYWSSDEYFDEESRRELINIKDDEEINDRFYKEISFGTSGMRGVIGAGPNRINKYTIRRAAYGLAQEIVNCGITACERGVAIAYDSRLKSEEFALETALVLGKFDIKSFLFEDVRSTPELSFAVRCYNCIAGVNITASHNPKEYNGFKVYWEDGAQISVEFATKILGHMAKCEDYKVDTITEEEGKSKGLILPLGEDCDKNYLQCLKDSAYLKDLCKNEGKDLSILYTPLHGVGAYIIERLFEETGFTNLFTVPEQRNPDAQFPTVKYPNPEVPEAFELPLEYAKKKQPDIVIATDPDADRLGLYAKNEEGYYVRFNGNQIGTVLLQYLCAIRKKLGILPENGVIIKSLPTSGVIEKIAKKYNQELINIPVGFKYIGEQMEMMGQSVSDRFIFGIEESHGYLAGTYTREKDAVGAALLLAEASLYYKKCHGKNLVQVLDDIYSDVGYFIDLQTSFFFEGQEGEAKMNSIMQEISSKSYENIAGNKVICIEDYNARIRKYNGEKADEELAFDSINMFKIVFEKGFIVVRPSGTEPKIKFYFSLSTSSHKSTIIQIEELKRDFFENLDSINKDI